MNNNKEKNAHIWQRDPNDWYVEPKECSLALFDSENFKGPVWDPACGIGNIVESAILSGLKIHGSDLIVRNRFCEKPIDFLESTGDEFQYNNIVCNPPFGIAEEFYHHAIEILPSGGKLAMILPMVWLSGFSKKRYWLPDSPLLKFYSISPRPSMPPGAVIQAGVKAGNGTKDFAWFVWQKGHNGSAEVGFLNTKGFKV